MQYLGKQESYMEENWIHKSNFMDENKSED